MNKPKLFQRFFLFIGTFFWVIHFVQGQALLDPKTHTQYGTNPWNYATKPQIATPTSPNTYNLTLAQFTANLGLDGGLTTEMYGYDKIFPGPTIIADENVTTYVKFENQLTGTHILPVDETIDWAAPANYPTTGVPSITHLHGGHAQPEYNGYPDAWYTVGGAETGSHYTGNGNKYANDQEEATLYYHDNTSGITRLNVYSGLEGFYLVQDKVWEQEKLNLPSGDYDIPLMICDKSFYDDGELFYPSLPGECYQPNATVHPFFFGDFNLVNGKVWPRMKVEARKYRFRLLNGSDSRFYKLALGKDLVFYHIGSDGGFINETMKIDSLLIAPGERYDVIIDFTGLETAEVVMTNNAVTPFPNGAPVDPTTSGQVMMFEVGPVTGPDMSDIPNGLRPSPLTAPNTNGIFKRRLQLSITFDHLGRLIPMHGDGQFGLTKFYQPITENPQPGVPEIWEILNLTANSHPIHIEQKMFRAVQVRPFNIDVFDQFGTIEYTGPAIPAPKELKDTYIIPAGHIGLLKVEFDMKGLYTWNNTMLSHQDFDSKRPMYIGDCTSPGIMNNAPVEFLACTDTIPGTIGGYVWEDLNTNGLKDPGEPGILNASVEIVSVPALNFVQTVYTDANGQYMLTNVPPATYYVGFANPGNYYPTRTDQGNNDMIDSDAYYNGSSDIIALSSGETNMSIYAGYVPDFLSPVLDPIPHPKFVNELPIPPVLAPTSGNDYYEVDIVQFTADLGIEGPTGPLMTPMYGYNGMFPGPTFEIQQNLPIKVAWRNMLPTGLANGAHILPLDQSIHWARPAGYPASGVPIVAHLHGGHTDADYDGYPDAWYTPGNTPINTGPFYTGDVYKYRNDQDPTMLWYHDHTIGITRLNVNAGLAGAYLIRNAHEASLNLPSGDYEIPLILTDRSFREDGTMYFPAEPAECWIPNPSVIEEFTGDFNIVNGKVWPYLEVEPRKYRFRVLNGADSRFYYLALDDGSFFQQIGTDGGFLDSPISIDSILLAPAERADLVIDFSTYAVGDSIALTNSAQAPFPMGGPPDPNTAGRVMQFRIVAPTGSDMSNVPAMLQPTPIAPIDTNLAPHRLLTLTLGADRFGRLKPLQGTHEEGAMGWGMPISENPQVGVAEVWEIINLTPDVHPIHLHQVMFQPLEKQRFDDAHYDATGEIKLIGNPIPVSMLEWKDTYQADPAYITRIAVEFDLEGLYVWHCHILSHEDHDMMRPMYIGDCSNPQIPPNASIKFLDCGNTGANAIVRGRVWEDLNCNGIRNPGEPWVENDYIEITSGFGFYTDGTYTNANGLYSFSVPAGVYSITMGNPGAYFVSPMNQGSNDNIDSDLLFGGFTEPFAVAAGSFTNNIWGGFMLCDPMDACNLTATYTTTCDVNGTPSDPSDDVYWINFTVNGGGANGWGSSNTGYTGDYGVPTTIGPISIAGGPYTIVVVDQEDLCCKKEFTIDPPAYCPQDCALEYLPDSYTWCEDNGTPNDPSDDIFYVKFVVTGGYSSWASTNGYSGTYGNAVQMGPYLIANGPLDFNVYDVNYPGCNLDVHFDAPAPCSEKCMLTYDYSVRCYDNGTPYDPSDDYFAVRLVAYGGPSASWISSLGLGANYGNSAVGGPYLIANGDLHFTISDSQWPGCSINATIPAPPPCSEKCMLTYDYSVRCHDNNTPNDPSDDYFGIKLVAYGGPSASWTSSLGLGANYGDADVGGPYLIANGDLNFTISDSQWLGCSISVTIPAPPPCSNNCNLTHGKDVWCEDQGNNDPNDDVFFFKIGVLGGPSAGWVSNIGLSANYGDGVVGGPYPANGGGFTFTVMDSQYPGCSLDITIDVPNNCGPNTVTSTANQTAALQGLDLEIVKRKTNSELSWINFAKGAREFVILRSNDGFNFEQIARVDAAMETDKVTFIDQEPKVGLNYYQIEIATEASKNRKSNIVNAVFDEQVAMDKKANIKLYPNPTEDRVSMDISSFAGQNVWVFIVDQIGKKVSSFPVENVTEEPISVELDDLASGYYNVIIKAEDGLFATEKLIIIKSF